MIVKSEFCLSQITYLVVLRRTQMLHLIMRCARASVRGAYAFSFFLLFFGFSERNSALDLGLDN